MTRPHSCLASAEYNAGYGVEPHGEVHWDEWHQCSVCGECYCADDMRAMAEEECALAEEAEAVLPWLNQERALRAMREPVTETRVAA